MIPQIPFMDKLTKLVPDDPLSQSQYVYYLTCVVFFGLLGFAISTWVLVITDFRWTLLFQGIFMFAVSLLSLFGVKQTRNGYIMIKQMMKNQKEIKDKLEKDQKETGNNSQEDEDSVEDMMKEFEGDKDNDDDNRRIKTTT